MDSNEADLLLVPDINQLEFAQSFSSVAELDNKFNLFVQWKGADNISNVLAGTRIGLYDLEEELGNGKFGRVKKGRHITGR